MKPARISILGLLLLVSCAGAIRGSDDSPRVLRLRFPPTIFCTDPQRCVTTIEVSSTSDQVTVSQGGKRSVTKLTDDEIQFIRGISASKKFREGLRRGFKCTGWFPTDTYWSLDVEFVDGSSSAQPLPGGCGADADKLRDLLFQYWRAGIH